MSLFSRARKALNIYDKTIESICISRGQMRLTGVNYTPHANEPIITIMANGTKLCLGEKDAIDLRDLLCQVFEETGETPKAEILHLITKENKNE